MNRFFLKSLIAPHAWAGAASFRVTIAVLILVLVPLKSGAQSSVRDNALIDARDARGLTPLVVAARSGQTKTVSSLLAQGASVDGTAADGRTALIAAVQSGKIETVAVLVAAGAALDRSARATGTALNVAENRGETEIAALLQKAGAHSTGKSAGDMVCVRPWNGDGFCGRVQSYSVRSVLIEVTRIEGCGQGCQAKEECSAGRRVGTADGLQAGERISVPSWCLTQTGVKP
jgi:hypothetical protein